MKRISFILSTVCVICFTFAPVVVSQAEIYKYIRLGSLQGQISYTGNHGGGYYSFYEDFTRVILRQGWKAGCRDWTDEHGTVWPARITGAPVGGGMNLDNCFPLEDNEGISLRAYWRYPPPKIVVDGVIQHDPWPQMGDEVNPDKIPGTADMMIEGWAGTWMGLTLHIKGLFFTSKYHDDYIICDYEWTNTGNIDADPEIELPDQTLKDLYILNQQKQFPNRGREWVSWYGMRPTDSLRIHYAYSVLERNATFDAFGRPLNSGWMQGPSWMGIAWLHMDTSPTDRTDNPAQPQMHCAGGPNIRPLDKEIGAFGEADRLLVYEVMQQGFKDYYGSELMTPEEHGVWPGTHYEIPVDQRNIKWNNDLEWFNWHHVTHSSCGPYTLKPGESIRQVWATVHGSISQEKGYEIGKAWNDGTCTWPGDISDLAEYYPAFGRYPDIAPTYNDQAKDRWVCTGKDSLFNSTSAAQFNVRNNYIVPAPPPPPSVTVSSLPDRINIKWDDIAESVPDFAGYRVYRAEGNYYPKLFQDQLIGTWTPIFECGKGTANALTHSYDDITAQRGIAYYYYVASFDDGTDTTPGVWGNPGSLESNQYSNRTTIAAHLTRAAGTLSTVRVVPNPFNLAARDLQFTGEQDKIMFIDLPPECTIKIYSESLDLVKTLEHTNGSGDEAWGRLAEEFSVTDTGQVIVSGVYLAYIETPSGESTVVKFVVVR